MAFGGVVFNIVVLALPCVKLTTETEAISGIIEDIKETELQEKKRLTTDPIKSGFSIAGSTMR